jgi:hypothetical protein
VPSPVHQAAFEALLAQARPLYGRGADEFERLQRLRWELTHDHDQALQALAAYLCELRAVLAEGSATDEEPGPS